MDRLPRTVTIGPKHKLKVVLCSPATLKALATDDDDIAFEVDALWVPTYERPVFGTIYIDINAKGRKRWDLFFHELIHAVNDLHAWVIQGVQI